MIYIYSAGDDMIYRAPSMESTKSEYLNWTDTNIPFWVASNCSISSILGHSSQYYHIIDKSKIALLTL
jgi:hypothetical protein